MHHKNKTPGGHYIIPIGKKYYVFHEGFSTRSFTTLIEANAFINKEEQSK